MAARVLIIDILPWVTIIERGLVVRNGIEVTTKPLRLARTVVGHLLAAEERSNPNDSPIEGRIPNLMRSFFLDENAHWPGELFFQLWPYLEHRQVIVRGLGKLNMVNGTMICGDLLKFFPMAFLITIDQRYNLPVLPLSKDLNLDSEIKLRLPYENLPPPEWPEHPGPTEGVLLNDKRTSVAKILRKNS